MKKLIFAVIFAAVLPACLNQNSGKKAAQARLDSLSATIYSPPPVPDMLTEPAARAQWAGLHYWDGFDFADTTYVGTRRVIAEQAFVDYIERVLRHVPQEVGNQSVMALFTKAQADKGVFLEMTEIAEKYLYDPNSPYRSDEAYLAVLQTVTKSPLLDRYELIRPEGQLKVALRNRVGHPAADFVYTVASGKTSRLYDIKSPFTLLFFNNPGCPSCADTMGQIIASPFLMRQVEIGTLVILGVYPDEDLEAWREYGKDFPPVIINSYDKALIIKDKELYDLKAIPTLYLLDGDKKVVLKDVMSIPVIEQAIYDKLNKS